MSASPETTSTVKKANEFDDVVIGGGLAGLLVARGLERLGRKVALIEALDALGGNCRPTQNPLGEMDRGLKHFPCVEGSADLLAWAESVVGAPFGAEPVAAPAVTFDSGRFQPFVGFGSQAIASADEVAYFGTASHWRMKNTPKDWIAHLAGAFKGTLFTQTYAAHIAITERRAGEVSLNANKKITGEEIYFCAPPMGLLELTAGEGAPPSARVRAKLTKGDVFTSICLDLVHAAPVTDSLAPHVLKGASEEPCVGFFSPPERSADGRELQRSQWTTFLPADMTEDSEHIAALLKYMKRQIKRAYESSLEGLVHERILVDPQSHGSAAGFLGEERLWPKTKNLRAVSSFFSERRNLLGMIEECRSAVLAAEGRIDAPGSQGVAAQAVQ